MLSLRGIIGMTRKYKIRYIIFYLLSLASIIIPVIFFTIKSYIESDLVHEKITLSMTILVTLLLTVIGIANKCVYRSKLWILLIGLYICLKNIMQPLIWIATCQVLDELCFNPLKQHYKNLFIINREIDKREV